MSIDGLAANVVNGIRILSSRLSDTWSAKLDSLSALLTSAWAAQLNSIASLITTTWAAKLDGLHTLLSSTWAAKLDSLDARLSLARAGNLDNLDAAVSSRLGNIKSIQRGVITITGSSATATITAVDTAKSLMRKLGSTCDTITSQTPISIVLTNPTTITAERGNTYGTAKVSWELTERY